MIGWALAVTVPECHLSSPERPTSHSHFVASTVGPIGTDQVDVRHHAHIGRVTVHVSSDVVIAALSSRVANMFGALVLVALMALAGCVGISVACATRGPPAAGLSADSGRTVLTRFCIARR